MSDYLTNPHDKFFKDLFTRQETAREFLQHYLPSEVVALLNLDSLHILKDSFIDPDLREHYSDLLYQVALNTASEVYIYVLFEHKSYPDSDISLQVLGYMQRIWEHARRQGQATVPIMPVVLYHGVKRWQVGRRLSTRIAVPTALLPYFPDYEYWLCDLSNYTEQEIKERVEQAVILQIGLLLLKYNQQPDFMEHFGRILQLLKQLSQQETALAYLETILRYVAGSRENVTGDEISQAVQAALAQGATLMPTLAQQWFEQGKQEGLLSGLSQGRAEGRQEGRQEGRAEGQRRLLRQYLATRFEVSLSHFERELGRLDEAGLTNLSHSIFTAASLAEVEATITRLLPPSDDSPAP